MNKHTPGPWKYTLTQEGEVGGRPTQHFSIHRPDGDSFGEPICELNTRWVMDDSTLQDEANARLIAAAPRMYELLVEARKIVRDMPPDWNYQWDVLAMAIRNLLDEIDGQEDSHA